MVARPECGPFDAIVGPPPLGGSHRRRDLSRLKWGAGYIMPVGPAYTTQELTGRRKNPPPTKTTTRAVHSCSCALLHGHKTKAVRVQF